MLTPIATEEERLRIIHECRQSGLTANEWCRQHGLRWNTYHTWVTRLKKKGLLEAAATVPTVMIHEPDLPLSSVVRRCTCAALLIPPSLAVQESVRTPFSAFRSCKKHANLRMPIIKLKQVDEAGFYPV